jgi:hypothetical protein
MFFQLPGYALQIILEHGEKLSAMIQLRELQNLLARTVQLVLDPQILM